MIKHTNLKHFLGFSYTKLNTFKRGYKYNKPLKLKKLDNSCLYSILKSIGLKPKRGNNVILFIFNSYKQYFKNLTDISNTMNKYPNFKKKVIIINNLKKNKNNCCYNLLLDIITFKYNTIYIKDYTKNTLFLSILDNLSKIVHNKNIIILE